jgi:CRP-like cAMP-binding protein
MNPGFTGVGIVHPTPAQVQSIPLFAELDEQELEQISMGLICRALDTNECLCRQGMDADSAYFVDSGTLNVFNALPGGGEVHLAKRGSGSMLGETSLVSRGIRTASVRAETSVTGFVMDHCFFQGALAQANSSAAKILHQLIQILCERLITQYQRLIAMGPENTTWVAYRNGSSIARGFNKAATRCSFPHQHYLPQLEVFSHFQTDEIRGFESLVRCFDLPRGTLLFKKDDAPNSCFFVIRGALELSFAIADEHVPLAILGPGTFLGTTEIISGEVRMASGRVREDATVFEIKASTLRELLMLEHPLAQKFQISLCKSLIVDLGKINKRVARATSQNSVNID